MQPSQEIVTGGSWGERLAWVVALLFLSIGAATLGFWAAGLITWSEVYKLYVALVGLALPFEIFRRPADERPGRVTSIFLLVLVAAWLPLAAIPLAEAFGFDVPARVSSIASGLLVAVAAVTAYVWFLNRQLARTRRRRGPLVLTPPFSQEDD